MNSKHIRFALAAAMVATLTAGGGGGDDGSSGSGTGTGTADPIDKYLGTIVVNCHAADSRVTTSASGPLRTQFTWSAPRKVSATKATYVLTLRTYTSTDCSGQAFSTVTLADDGNTYFQVDGTETIGTQTVDKTTSGQGVFFHGLSAQSITVNGVSYTGQPYTDQTPATSAWPPRRRRRWKRKSVV